MKNDPKKSKRMLLIRKSTLSVISRFAPTTFLEKLMDQDNPDPY